VHCIVSYLYIYIELLAVHKNQKRDAQREESSLERTNRGTCSPVNKVEQVDGESWFQSAGSMIEKACVYMYVMCRPM